MISCEDYSKETYRINFQGISGIDSIEQGNDGVFIDSIAFTSFKLRYLLSGNFVLNGEEEFYTIFLDRHPMDTTARVDTFHFDSDVLNEQLTNCVFRINENVCEITWTGDNSRIYLKDKINEAH